MINLPHIRVKSEEEAIKVGKRLAEKTDVTIALITEQYLKENHHPELKTAQKLGKPMFAVVQRGIDWSEYGEYPWIKIFEFDSQKIKQGDASEYEQSVREIRDWLDKNLVNKPLNPS